MSTIPLISVEELKAYPLPIKENQWTNIGDDQIETIIQYASENIVDYLDIAVASAYYTERIPGYGQNKLILDQYPVQYLLSVTSRDNQENSTLYDLDDFVINTAAGLIFFKDRTRYKFWNGYDWIVTYRAGYNTIPGPIKHSVALQVVQMLNPMFRGGNSFSEVKLIDGVNEQIVDLLEKYKRKRIA